jgi:hypothetical protein
LARKQNTKQVPPHQHKGQSFSIDFGPGCTGVAAKQKPGNISAGCSVLLVSRRLFRQQAGRRRLLDMSKRLQGVAIFSLFAASMIALAAPVFAAGPERYLHVKVEDGANGESVNVNVPLSMAQKILPAINHGDLHNGCVRIHNADMNGIDVRTLLEAVRNAPDNEFVTVKERNNEEIRVAKSSGSIIVHVKDHDGKEEKVDVTVPIKVVDALLSTVKDNELDIASALRALSDAGDILLVTVQDEGQKVRVWVDSRSTSE